MTELRKFYEYKSSAESVRPIKCERDGFVISDRYELFRDGRVFNHFSQRFLTFRKNTEGYFRCDLVSQDNYSRKTFFIHKLLAENFIPKPPNADTILLMDGNKENYHIDNLLWVDNSTAIKMKMSLGQHFNSNPYLHYREIKKDIEKGVSFHDLFNKYSKFGISKEFLEEVISNKIKIY